MTDVSTLKVVVDTTQVKRGGSDLDAFAAKGGKAEAATNKFGKATGDASRSLFSFNSILKIGSFALAARSLLGMADAVKQLDSRLKLVTSSQQNLAVVQSRLVKIASDARVGLSDLGFLYAQVARSTKEMGIGQEQLLAVTKTISQAVTISGASAASANAALIQLSQGLAAGALRGQELNSVMEQTPRVAEALAEGLGVGIGQLRQMGNDGKISAEAVISALTKAAKSVDEEFQKTNKTIGQSATVAKDALTLAIGEFDKASGASDGLVTAIESVTSGLNVIGQFFRENKEVIETAGGMVKWGVIIASFLPVFRAVKFGFGAIIVAAKTTHGIIVSIGAALAALNIGSTALANTNSGLAQTYTNVNDKILETKKRIEELTASKEKNSGYLNPIQKGILESDLKDLAALEAKSLSIEKKFKEKQSLANPVEAPLDAAKAPTAKGFVAKAKKEKEVEKSAFEKEVEDLKKKNLLLAESSELEKVSASIRIGEYGKLNEAQKEELKNLASAADARKVLQEIKDGTIERTTAIEESNAQLKKEIELMGESGDALQARTIAENEGVIAQKNSQIATLEIIGGQQERVRLLRDEVSALQDRSALLNAKEEKKTALEQDKTKGAQNGLKAYIDSIKSSSKDTEEAVKNTFTGLESNITDFLTKGKADWSSYFQNIFQEVVKLQVIRPMLSNLLGGLTGGAGGGGGGGGFGGLLTGIVGSLFSSGFGGGAAAATATSQYSLGGAGGGLGIKLGGAFADGGSPPVGMPSLVGERGPELFIPKTSGTIIPNDKIGGKGSVSVSYSPTINIDSRSDQAQVEAMVSKAVMAGNAKLLDDLRTAGRL